VRVTHTPSGVQACVDIGRSQHINNIVAMDMILAGIRTRNFNNERRLDTRERE
jgi:protein subunit release factor A